MQALRASGKKVGVCGAGVIGPCNPDWGGNYKVSYAAVSESDGPIYTPVAQ